MNKKESKQDILLRNVRDYYYMYLYNVYASNKVSKNHWMKCIDKQLEYYVNDQY